MSSSAPSEPTVVTTRNGGVATVAINRPAELGALDHATRAALLDALTGAAEDPEVRCVVLTGSGRGFCVGQDLKEHVTGLRSGDTELARSVTEHYNPLAHLVATMPKPVVAALNGVTAGAGASLAFAADLRILRADAAINLAFTGIALSCDTGASWFLPRLVGVAKAKELLLMPRTIAAAEALSLGLVTAVAEPDEFEATVADLAGRLAAGPTLAYGAVRQAVAYSCGHELGDSLAHEASLMALTGASGDHRAAVEAFLAKRPPEFTGR